MWPGLDDKRLAAWNGLTISALAEAGAVLERPDFVAAAAECAAFVLDEMRVNGALRRTWKDGRARLNAYLEDHAFLLEGLLALYEASFDPRWFTAARELADELIARFCRSGRRRVLRDFVGPRAAGGAAQGPGGPPDSVGERQRCAWACFGWPR